MSASSSASAVFAEEKKVDTPGTDDHKDEKEKIKDAWRQAQKQLKSDLITDDSTLDWTVKTDDHEPSQQPLRLVGGVDLSFVGEGCEEACAALVVCEFPSMKVVYEAMKMVTLTEPYISGFLAFREVEFLQDLIEELKLHKPELLPQVVLADGNGVLHHEGFGLACHLGVLSSLPTIGIGKTLLLVDGLDAHVVDAECSQALHKAGDVYELKGASGAIWGAALRSSKKSINPIFVSVGHRLSLPTAINVTVQCCQYRIPEPIRQADLRSREYIRQWKAKHQKPSAS